MIIILSLASELVLALSVSMVCWSWLDLIVLTALEGNPFLRETNVQVSLVFYELVQE